ncbi:MAG: short-chain dehydrogenase [Chloroflexi bacterium RIFOXYD12_FULL_57_15]|nr:MAG: short-chain dehydrogenase [Chloroflexi bacterium RIFOXYD12_FULL_57_15]
MIPVDGRLNGKVCLVTGATSGIGEVTARALTQMGATVIVVGRDLQRGAATLSRIKAAAPTAQVEFMLADLSSQAQIRQLAQEFKRKYSRLDVLVNNAGGVSIARKQSVDGIEMTFALDHLNYFLLTHLLLDTIKASAPARIVNVASEAHRRVPGINFNDLQSERGYNSVRAYGQAKLANVLFTYELARRLDGTNISVNVLHPGVVATDMWFADTRLRRNNGILRTLVVQLIRLAAISPEQGAQTMIYLATSPEVEGVTGKYFAKEKEAQSSPASHDHAAATRLWQVSETLTKL